MPHASHQKVVALIFAVVACVTFASGVRAAGTEPDDATITIDFGDAVDIRLIVDYVAARTGTDFIYDEDLTGTVTLRTSRSIPQEALYGMLESILAFKGWALVPSPGGFVKVVRSGDAVTSPTQFLRPDQIGQLPYADVVVSQAVQLQHMDAATVASVLRPVIGDTAGPVLTRPTVQGGTGARVPQVISAGTKLVAVPDQRLLIVTDYAPNVQRIVDVIRMLDSHAAGEPLELKVFRLQHVRADQIAPRMLEYLRALRVANPSSNAPPLVDEDLRLNALVVTATADDIVAAEALLAQLDVAAPEAEQPYRVIFLRNSHADQMVQTLRQVMASVEDSTPADELLQPAADVGGYRPTGSEATASGGASAAVLGPVGSDGRQLTAIADPHTNALILLGNAEQQAVVADIVERLDKRRPQVMIEAVLMAVDADTTFDVGAELLKLQSSRNDAVLGATNFGLSKIDFSTRSVAIKPAMGLTGFLVEGGDIRSIIYLFEQEANGKVVSHPRTLVNDNETAVFRSEQEAPFQTISNLGADTTTVTFGGYENAGTTLEITPHISEADYLQLEIAVELSAFQGEATADTPPPRTRSTLDSKVTVPDDSTVLIGGINRTDERKVVSRVPLLGSIPLLGALFRRTTVVTGETTLYVFVRVRIARDEDFADLKSLTNEVSRSAGSPPVGPHC